MSIRALGRQFQAQWVNRNRWYPNAPGAQGKLFFPNDVQRTQYRPDRATVEAGRRAAAGENNPKAPWRTPILQHHFQPTHDPRTGRKLAPPPVQGKLFP